MRLPEYVRALCRPRLALNIALLLAGPLLCLLAFWLGGRVTVGEGDVAPVPRDTYVTPAAVPPTAEGTPVIVDHCRLLRGDEVVVVEEGDDLVALSYRHVVPSVAPYRCPDGTRYITYKSIFASMEDDFRKEIELDEERERLRNAVTESLVR